MKKLWTVAFILLGCCICSAPALAKDDDGGATLLRMAITGPAIVLISLSAAVVFLLALIGMRKYRPIVHTIREAACALPAKRVIHTIWGILLELLIVSICVLLFKMGKPLALIGVALLFLGIVFAGAGVCVAGLTIGRRVQAVFAQEESDIRAFQYGLWLLVIGAIFPFAGWIVVLLVTAGGIGSLMATIVARSSSDPQTASTDIVTISR